MRTIALFALFFPLLATAQEAVKPRHNLAPRYAEAADPADRELARFMQANCKDREAAAFYLPRTKMIVSVGRDGTIGGVVYDSVAMRTILRSESEIVEAHCHIMDTKELEKTMPRLGKVLAQVGPQETRERFWMEIPSDGDVTNAIYLETRVFARHPRGTVEHRLVVVEPGLPPHVINYGLTPVAELALRDLVREKKFGTGAMMEYDSEYSLPLYRLDADRCKPFVLEQPCTPRPVRGLIDIINGSGVFFVHDRGYIE